MNIRVGSTFIFSRKELCSCLQIARNRNSRNRGIGIVDQRRSRRHTSEEIELHGVLGEFAFCKMFNLETKQIFDTTPRSKHTDTFDATLHDNRLVDVKTVMDFRNPVRVSQWHRDRHPDFYAGMYIDRFGPDDDPWWGTTAIFLGMCHHTQLLQNKYQYHGNGYKYPQHLLQSWPQVDKY